ncbi:BACON domain-containing protein [Alistipes shahii]|uniref:BACON domain-containing protein n=1 Tax=Alistipes shahii TaxID=328814 RepID=UPI0011073290|nr:leucine-rich repeat domain-containing protein [Alistipes shahii]
MKNLKSFYLLALAAALAFAGCKKDDGGNPLPGTLTIEKTEYALDAVENRTATVAFTAAAGWTLSVVYDDAESAADWLTVTPASGTAGEQTVELSATRNYRTSDRTAYADLVCGEQSVRLTVTQAAASDDTDFTTLFDPDFAKELQKQGIIADAENITPEDMEKIATMTELDVSGTYENPGTLTSLQGIEYFESLTQLSCYYNQLTSLDISANTALTTLWCYNNSLTSLDVSGCTALTELSCPFNQLTSLDLSVNTALTGLSCSSNQLTTLDVSANTALTELYCYGNQLTSLDVSANMALMWLSCSYNSLETLDISKNTALTQLDCSSNSLTTLDVSANTALTWLSCENNPGDGVSTFPVTAWFDNDTKPDNLEIYQGQWTYDGKTITIDFRKVE